MNEHAPTARPFDITVRVYWEDTDAGGVVFYANYLKYFERARTEWLRAAGISQQALRARAGLMFVVASTAVEYHAPARLDDMLVIRSRVLKLGRVAVVFQQEAWRQPEADGQPTELLAAGQIRVGCVEHVSMRPAPLPEALRASLAASLVPA